MKSFTPLIWMHFNHRDSKHSALFVWLVCIELTSQLCKIYLSLTSIPTTSFLEINRGSLRLNFPGVIGVWKNLVT